MLEVEDDGPGHGPAERASGSSSASTAPTRHAPRASGGAGLGLSIVAAIVEAHGGTVGASPAPSGGTRVTIELPLEAPDGRGAPAAES